MLQRIMLSDYLLIRSRLNLTYLAWTAILKLRLYVRQ